MFVLIFALAFVGLSNFMQQLTFGKTLKASIAFSGEILPPLVLSMPKKSNRGSNPNSHGNNPRIGQAKLIRLSDRLWDLAKAIGNGNQNAGVRKLCELGATMIKLNYFLWTANNDHLVHDLSTKGTEKRVNAIGIEEYHVCNLTDDYWIPASELKPLGCLTIDEVEKLLMGDRATLAEKTS